MTTAINPRVAGASNFQSRSGPDAIETATTEWQLGTRVAFRFFFLLTFLYSIVVLFTELLWRLPLPLQVGNAWSALIDPWWRPFSRFVAAHVLKLVVINPQRVQLVGFVCVLIAAVLGTALWSLLDRERRQYAVLYDWLRVYCRFCAAVFLISYGLSKVFLNQGDFPPEPSGLLRPMGAFDPQGFFFAYLSVSPVYQVFAGLVELSAGILLVFSSTVAVGALLAAAAMANVVVVNWAFQIPMYRISLTTFVFALFLLMPQMPRLFNVLVLNRPTQSLQRRPLFRGANANRFATAAAVCFLVAEFVFLSYQSLADGRHWRPRPVLYGAYVVETFQRIGAPESEASGNPWSAFAVDPKPSGNRMAADAFGTIVRLRDTTSVMIRTDTVARTLTFVRSSNPKNPSRWSYATTDSNHLVLSGVDDMTHPTGSGARAKRSAAAGQAPTDPGTRDSVRVVLRRLNLKSFPLLRSR